MSSAFVPCGLITLTTDFGHQDPFVGVMKGAILSRFAGARIIDLTHGIRAQHPEEAGFWLARSFTYFPVGTVHVAVVDPGVGTARDIICLCTQGHALLAPDNGLLAAVHARSPDAQAVTLAAARLADLGISRVSATFHGRDIFAPVAAELAAGRYAPGSLGPARNELASLPTKPPETVAGGISGTVVAVDHFGNLITNIESKLLEGLRAPSIEIGGRTLRLSRTYAEVGSGELLALINSFDVLEIASRDGNAATALGIGPGFCLMVREQAPPAPGGRPPAKLGRSGSR
ncbi:MAG TPA: SAM-dependent chlorinase/fluorinase [Steroidobacteraceae bacterium]|nr:SAM-dependent chlorinase/fluorinase [Steroidobacteraceae bacterium]